MLTKLINKIQCMFFADHYKTKKDLSIIDFSKITSNPYLLKEVEKVRSLEITLPRSIVIKNTQELVFSGNIAIMSEGNMVIKPVDGKCLHLSPKSVVEALGADSVAELSNDQPRTQVFESGTKQIDHHSFKHNMNEQTNNTDADKLSLQNLMD